MVAAMSVVVFGSWGADTGFSETLVYDELVRGATDEADLEGPNFEATKAFLSINRLYSYFAGERMRTSLSWSINHPYI